MPEALGQASFHDRAAKLLFVERPFQQGDDRKPRGALFEVSAVEARAASANDSPDVARLHFGDLPPRP